MRNKIFDRCCGINVYCGMKYPSCLSNNIFREFIHANQETENIFGKPGEKKIGV
jgi:hypothetical protein